MKRARWASGSGGNDYRFGSISVHLTIMDRGWREIPFKALTRKMDGFCQIVFFEKPLCVIFRRKNNRFRNLIFRSDMFLRSFTRKDRGFGRSTFLPFFKNIGEKEVTANFNGKITVTNSTLVALFDIEGEDLTFGVSESMGQTMLFIVLRCKECGYEDWEYVFSKDDLGYALNEFKNAHRCVSLAERIAQDIDQDAGGDEFPQSLQDLIGCNGDCENCGERERE